MPDSYKKTVGIFMLLLLAAICFLIAKIFFPEFYSNTITLTLAGDVDSLSRYISSFGYGAFAVSLLPGIIISWIGEVIGIEISFHIGRIFFRDEARRIIEKKHMLRKVDKYSSVYAMAVARAIPYSPNILFTAAAVLTKLTTRQHLRATLFGKIPSVVIEVVLGHDLIHFSQHGIRFVVLFILTLGGFFVHRRYKQYKCGARKQFF